MKEIQQILKIIAYLLVIGIGLTVIFFMLQINDEINEKRKATEEIIMPKVWKLNWSEEFEESGKPDSKNWVYDFGDGCPNLCGWGNNESQFYTEEKLKNAHVANGKLVIQAYNEKIGTKDFSSAKLTTKGLRSFNRGRLEIRAKNPTGKGTWPAIWMMPLKDNYGGWPSSGEIDIMEHVGYSPDSILGTVHTRAFNHIDGTQDGGAIVIPDSETAFHNYAIEWDQKSIKWFVDSLQYHEFLNLNEGFEEWPFDQEFYLILNLAIGGNWGGKMGIDTSAFPAKFEIDYVRHYLKE